MWQYRRYRGKLLYDNSPMEISEMRYEAPKTLEQAIELLSGVFGAS